MYPNGQKRKYVENSPIVIYRSLIGKLPHFDCRDINQYRINQPWWGIDVHTKFSINMGIEKGKLKLEIDTK